jgi:hypothetical protein
MSEQRRVRMFLDDGHPEASDYDSNYLTVGIDPVLHPSWRAHRPRSRRCSLAIWASGPIRVARAVRSWLRRKLGRVTSISA